MKLLNIEEWEKEDIEVYNTIIEKLWDFNISDTEWYEYTITEFTNDIEAKGFYSCYDQVNFSGFHSQGDGACFDADINILALLKSNKKLTDFRNVVRNIKSENIHRGAYLTRDNTRYSHECSYSLDNIEYYNGLSRVTQKELMELEEYISNYYQDLCIELYDKLRVEYEYLTSKEVIKESLSVNNYLFNEVGEMHI